MPHRIAVKIDTEMKTFLDQLLSCSSLCSPRTAPSPCCSLLQPSPSHGDTVTVYGIPGWSVADLAAEHPAWEAVGENLRRCCAVSSPAQTHLTILQRSSGSKEIVTEQLQLVPGAAVSSTSPPHVLVQPCQIHFPRTLLRIQVVASDGKHLQLF